MKVFIILLGLITFSQAFAQTSATFASPLSNTSSTTFGNWNTERLHNYLKVTYFGELSGSSIKKWDDNQINAQGQRTRDPMSMWQSFNILTKLYDRTSFFMSPRFFTVIGDRNELRPNQDQNIVVMDDWQFGINQNWIKTDKVSWDSRLTHRAPFSIASRNEQLNSQVELLQVVTWKPIPQIFVFSQTNARYFMYKAGVEEERYRLNQMTAINWIFNDKWKAQIFNEFDLQHRNPTSGSQHRDWNYFKKYKNYPAVGLGYNPLPHLTLMPYLKALNDVDIRPETVMFGLWAFGTVF